MFSLLFYHWSFIWSLLPSICLAVGGWWSLTGCSRAITLMGLSRCQVLGALMSNNHYFFYSYIFSWLSLVFCWRAFMHVLIFIRMCTCCVHIFYFLCTCCVCACVSCIFEVYMNLPLCVKRILHSRLKSLLKCWNILKSFSPLFYSDARSFTQDHVFTLSFFSSNNY